jgi:hypothetical protein
MGHYDKQWDALKYRTAEGLYDMKTAREVIEATELGTKCDRNKPIKIGTDELAGWTEGGLEAPTDNDPVSSPNHYLKLGYECIEIIACSLSKEAFKGYCMGNFLKYRFRMGDKGEMQQDFNKSKEYLMLYDKYSHLCKDIPF